jgi:aminopeptidase N
LRVRQQRFFADPRVPASRRRGRWPIPLVVKWGGGDGEIALRRFLVNGANGRVELDGERTPRWYFGNAGAGGFYRVRHDPKTTAALLAELPVALTAVERLALVGDQWALVRSGASTVESFLAVPNVLGDEPDADVLDGIAGPLSVLDDQVVDPGSLAQAALRSWIAEVFGPAFRAAGWSPRPAEPDADRLRRSSLLRLVGLIAEDRSVAEAARERLDRYLADRSALEPNLADPVVSLAARTGDETLYERYRGVVAGARTPQERRRFLLSLASFRDLGCIRRTLEAILAGEVPTQDVAFVLMRLFSNPAARESTWTFLTRNWAPLRERVPPLMISRLIESTPALREARYAREVARFFHAHPVPEAARALKQALELFRLNAELRRRAGRRLARWLAARSDGAGSPA